MGYEGHWSVFCLIPCLHMSADPLSQNWFGQESCGRGVSILRSQVLSRAYCCHYLKAWAMSPQGQPSREGALSNQAQTPQMELQKFRQCSGLSEWGFSAGNAFQSPFFLLWRVLPP